MSALACSLDANRLAKPLHRQDVPLCDWRMGRRRKREGDLRPESARPPASLPRNFDCANAAVALFRQRAGRPQHRSVGPILTASLLTRIRNEYSNGLRRSIGLAMDKYSILPERRKHGPVGVEQTTHFLKDHHDDGLLDQLFSEEAGCSVVCPLMRHSIARCTVYLIRCARSRSLDVSPTLWLLVLPIVF